jgi:hypothetical protein
LLQQVLIGDDAVTFLGTEDHIPKEFASYVVMDFEQLRYDLLADRNNHLTNVERCCVVVVNDEWQVLFYGDYLMILNAHQN